MIKKKITKLIGLKKEDFDGFLTNGQIHAQRANLIPTLKTGDEMALTSIFLSTIRLVKEYRDSMFKEFKLPRSGKMFYYTELCIPEVSKSRIDGLIIIVKSGKISDACLFEMKNKKNNIDEKQIQEYMNVAKTLGIKKLITVSNEFVSTPTNSPINIRVPKNFDLLHFSWTYLLTKGQLLLFKNENNIKDEDQIEIMRESLEYFKNPLSGISGYTQMKSGWKELAEYIRAQKPLKLTDKCIEEAVLSWYEEEKDMALLMSRKLGVLVKSSPRDKTSLKKDIKKLLQEHYINGSLSIKNSVSDIKIIAEFERRMVSMSIKIIPPLDKGTIARISWLEKQLENSKKHSSTMFNKISSNIWIEADIKYTKTNIRVRLSEIDTLRQLTKGKEVQAFHILMINSLGASFTSTKKFIQLADKMILEYYEGIVQNMTNWNKPTPKLVTLGSKD